MGTRENKLQKLQIPQNKILITYDDFTCVFSIAVNFFFLRHRKILPFGIISDNL